MDELQRGVRDVEPLHRVAGAFLVLLEVEGGQQEGLQPLRHHVEEAVLPRHLDPVGGGLAEHRADPRRGVEVPGLRRVAHEGQERLRAAQIDEAEVVEHGRVLGGEADSQLAEVGRAAGAEQGDGVGRGQECCGVVVEHRGEQHGLQDVAALVDGRGQPAGPGRHQEGRQAQKGVVRLAVLDQLGQVVGVALIDQVEQVRGAALHAGAPDLLPQGQALAQDA